MVLSAKLFYNLDDNYIKRKTSLDTLCLLCDLT